MDCNGFISDFVSYANNYFVTCPGSLAHGSSVWLCDVSCLEDQLKENTLHSYSFVYLFVLAGVCVLE